MGISKGRKLLVWIGLISAIILSVLITANAANKSIVLHGVNYQIDDEHEYDKSKGKKVEEFPYGGSTLGELSIIGSKKALHKFDGTDTYGATDEITLGYSYDGKFHTNTKEDWNIVSSDVKSVNGYDISKKVEQGAIVVQKSDDGKVWENSLVLCNCFKKNAKDMSGFYKISKEDVLEGKYFRVTIAYQMRRKTGTEPGIIFDKDVFLYKKFMEVYDFYVCYGENPIIFTDIETGENLNSKSTVKKGFIVNKGGTDYSVSIKKDNGKPTSVKDLSSITDPGKYDITITSDTGEKYHKNLSITEGTILSEAKPVLYEGGKNGEYQISEPIKGKSMFGLDSLTTIKIAQDANTVPVKGTKNGFDGYGVSGKRAGVYLNVDARRIPNASDWEIYADSYGKKEKETIGKSDDYEGVLTGQVDKGALVVLKSSDGIHWEEAKSVCTKTTDFYSYYGEKGDVHIYDPDGKDVLNGVYLKILYAYEMYQNSTKTYDRCLEVYEIYLCSGDLNAVTFKNMSVTDEVIKNQIGEDKEYRMEIYKSAQSLKNGSCSVSGFEVDTTKNPTVTYTVKHDGNNIAIPSDHKFTASGRYDIALKGALGNKSVVTLFVDRLSSDEAFEKYFSSEFISGVRIFSEGEFPEFEGGKTKYHISAIDEGFLPISGTINNTRSNKEIKITGNRKSKEGTISEPGEYIATFTTAQRSDEGTLPGDYRVFTYRFNIKKEGTAPGPVINKKELDEYARSSMVDSYPMYYGITYHSASKGYITYAFLDKETAKDYSLTQEGGTVEKQDDGTYRYRGDMLFSQKVEYVSAKDLTDARYKFAEQAVQIGYFDLSDDFTYATLSDDDLRDINPRTYELDKSVVIFAKGEKERLCDLNALPIISDKPYYYVFPGKGSDSDKNNTDFKLIKDEHGYDSEKAYLIDKNGKKYNLKYGESVGEQLNRNGCPSGIVSITEETCYGQACEPYDAVFIADGDNTGKLELLCDEDGNENWTPQSFKQQDEGKTIEVKAFKISSICDELDPYCIVKVVDPSNNKTYYVADQKFTKIWSDQGEYTVSLVNRLGFSFSINVIVKNSEYATISFFGDGVENTESIVVKKDEKNVELPRLSRTGYVLVGYEDNQGTRYTDSISKITFSGSKVLTPIWEANKYKLIYKDSNGKEKKVVDVEYGSKYEVESFEWGKDEVFKGWLKDGKPLEGSIVSVDKEADIVFIPIIENSEVGENNSQNESSISEDKSRLPVVVILCTISVVLLVVAFRKRENIEEIVKRVLRKSDSEKGDKDDEV